MKTRKTVEFSKTSRLVTAVVAVATSVTLSMPASADTVTTNGVTWTYITNADGVNTATLGPGGGVFRCSRRSFQKEHLEAWHVSGSTVCAGDVSEEYRWYDMVEPWKPEATDSICFGCADWDGKKTNFNPNVEAIWLDGIELVRVD